MLRERLTFVAERAGRGELDGVEIEDGKLFIARTPPAVPEAARDLALRLNGLLPRVRITEVLSDVVDEMVIAEAPGSVGHAGEAEIGAVGEYRRQQRRFVAGRIAGAQMDEPIRESGPRIAWRSGTSATTTTSPPAGRLSTPITNIPWRRSGTTARPRPRMGNTSVQRAAPERSARSTRNTASTPAR
jgi:hypothetical protein